MSCPHFTDNDATLYVGDCREVLASLPESSARTCVTSPPYWGLRDYGVAGQLGAERTPAEYVANLVAVFREVRRALTDDGTLWLNLGDSYAGSWGAQGRQGKTGALAGRTACAARQVAAAQRRERGTGSLARTPGLKNKDLVGIPWRVAFALQEDGWYLRSDIVWCLSGGAWVYARTQKGDMPVMVKDLVRLDPSTVSLWNGEAWTRVLGWGPSNDTSQRFELVLRSGERIGCTGGHLWPTQRGNVAARDLRPGDVIKTCRLPEPLRASRPGFLTDDVLWLCGLYLAEGSRSGATIQLSLNADEAEWLPRIRASVAHLGGTVTHTTSGRCLNVRIYGGVVAATLDRFIGGRTANDKHLRNNAWMLDDASLRLIAFGYLDGDAHHDVQNGRWRLGFSRNYLLERDLRTLAARLGATLTLRPVVVSYQGGKRPAFRGEWRWERSGHFNEADRGEVVEIRASRARQFWDIAVEDEPHLFALASGVLTHNCKPNPMPESVTDRPTKSHEYVFLLAKSERYFYEADTIREPHVDRREKKAGASAFRGQAQIRARGSSDTADRYYHPKGRNARSVWTIATRPSGVEHFATMPPDLARRCILAGSAPGDTVLDPFSGAGTTGLVAMEHGRRYLGVELNARYADASVERWGRVQRALFAVAAGGGR
ncbi:DNA methyltransferase [Myxococcus sp. Y35]|uniref:DNA methyltransferase n=1 Tax=Pseudomyxococcus flavus TaxID=3115648 RepID=UPI003CE865CC